MENIQYYTEEGLKRLMQELSDMKTKGRADMSKQIAEARDKGDLSENAEYDAAKDAQGLLEMRISKLETTLSFARVLDESTIDTSKVSVLCTVKVLNLKTKQEHKYTLVAEEEADLRAGKISVKSPIGKGLLGKAVGDTSEITAPAGLITLKVLAITLE